MNLSATLRYRSATTLTWLRQPNTLPTELTGINLFSYVCEQLSLFTVGEVRIELTHPEETVLQTAAALLLRRSPKCERLSRKAHRCLPKSADPMPGV